jgi:phenylpropionate dioxygenase-like ring-hydroxylating dioxygenase large terminal subunit
LTIIKEDLNKLVKVDEGLVSRIIFYDKDIHELELEKIFLKSWLFICHESQLKNVGDYITTYMGEDPVIAVKDSNGKIRVFLNACRHRGMKLCREDFGNTKFFKCPYHGWTFDINGKLIGVPRIKTAYLDKLDTEKWGLIEVKNVINYKGFIWASWEPVKSFEEYLGGMKFYLDLFIERFDNNIEIYGGIQKWIIPTNWKIPAENFIGDSYHAPITHESTVKLGLRPPYSDQDFELYAGNGHGFGAQLGGTGKGVISNKNYYKLLTEGINKLARKYGEFVKNIMPMGHVTIFPNFSILDLYPYTFIRVWHPKGPEMTEVYGGLLVDSRLSENDKMEIFTHYITEFGPAGIFDQDDAEIWSNIEETARGIMGRRMYINYQAGLGSEIPASLKFNADIPGKLGTPFGDINFRGFYATWLEFMRS